MSSDLTARNVIAREYADRLVPPTEFADAVLAALAAAGWRLEPDALTQQETR